MGYDALWRTQIVTNTLGIRTFTRYDALGRVTATIENYVAPGTPTTSITNVTSVMTYNALGQVVTSVDALGNPTTMGYNGLGQRTTVTDATGAVTTYGFDGSGSQRWVKDPVVDGVKRYRVTLVDGLGRTIRTVDNYENGTYAPVDGTDRDLITTVRYDRAGRQLATTDALGRITRFRYNGRDQVLKVTENADGACNLTQSDCNLVTRYQYDRMGNRTATIDAENRVQRRTTYDAADWPRVERDPLGNEKRWTYHSNRTGLPLTEWTGVVTRTYAYDARGLLTSALAPDGRQEFRYDALGRRTVMGDHIIDSIDPSDPVTVTTTYDPLNRITSAAQVVSGVNETARYGRDAVGRQTSLTYPSGYGVTYGYTPRHELKTVSEGGLQPLATYTYDPDGWLRMLDITPLSIPSTPMRLWRGNDAAGRLTTLSYFQPTLDVDNILSVDYAVNRGGEQTQKVIGNNTPQTTTENYAYDGVGRLVATASPGVAGLVSAYDKVGNEWKKSTRRNIPVFRDQ